MRVFKHVYEIRSGKANSRTQQKVATTSVRLLFFLTIPAIWGIFSGGPQGVVLISAQERVAGTGNDYNSQGTPEPLGIWEQISVPVSHTLFSADFAPFEGGWAVGVDGEILGWNGKTWVKYDSPVKTGLNGVKVLSVNDGWAVGAEGTILHWNGLDWKVVPSPTDKETELKAVAFLSPRLGWAVGGRVTEENSGTLAFDSLILKWDGSVWAKVPNPAHYPLNAIAMSSEKDGWAVGPGIVLHWDGVSWQKYSKPQLHDDFTYYSIAMNGSEDGWIVGQRVYKTNTNLGYTQEGIILHWNGSEWTEFQRTKLALYSVSMVTPRFGWAVGGNNLDSFGGSLLLHWDGSAWIEVPSPTTRPLAFVWAHDIHDGWIFAGGDNINSGFEGAVFRYVIELTPAPASSATASAIPTNTSPATATRIPTTPTLSVPIATPPNTPVEVNGPFQNIGLWLFVIGLLTVFAGAALFILRRWRKV
jgi:photosystem II stability/assembly factor-like uncharacterized protein